MNQLFHTTMGAELTCFSVHFATVLLIVCVNNIQEVAVGWDGNKIKISLDILHKFMYTEYSKQCYHYEAILLSALLVAEQNTVAVCNYFSIL